MRILIVEDNPINLELVVQLLEDDYELLVAKDGAEGLEMALQERPDLVLLDLSLPKMSGWEVCQEIRSQLGEAAMPLVALVPLLILWLGLGFGVKVAVVFLMSVFPITINTWLGVTAVPKTLLEVGKSFVASDSVILRRIILPATLPYIMAGIRLAVGRAVVAMVIAEFFTTISGLGAIIINSANNFDTATMFVPIFVLMVMAVGLNTLIGAVEKWVAPWQAEIAGRD